MKIKKIEDRVSEMLCEGMMPGRDLRLPQPSNCGALDWLIQAPPSGRVERLREAGSKTGDRLSLSFQASHNAGA